VLPCSDANTYAPNIALPLPWLHYAKYENLGVLLDIRFLSMIYQLERGA
jgi:hypothetical protein